MLKFLHTADWHLGAPKQPDCYQDCLGKLIALADEKDVDFVLCVGDIFDQPKVDRRVSDYLLQKLADNVGTQFIFTVGNHDYLDKSHSYHNLKYLWIVQQHFPNVVVLEPGELQEFENYNIGVLPDDLKLGAERIKFDIAGYDTAIPLILASHADLPTDDIKTCKKIANEYLKKYNATYLALGHIHKHLQISENCWYPGSLYPKTFSCQDGISFVEIDDKGNCESKMVFLDIPSRTNVDLEFEEGKDSEASVVECVKENYPKRGIVKLRFKLPTKVWASLDKKRIEKDLIDAGFIQVKLENDPVVDKRERKDAEKLAVATTVEDELKIILEGEDFGMDKEKVFNVCKKYLVA